MAFLESGVFLLSLEFKVSLVAQNVFGQATDLVFQVLAHGPVTTGVGAISLVDADVAAEVRNDAMAADFEELDRRFEGVDVVKVLEILNLLIGHAAGVPVPVLLGSFLLFLRAFWGPLRALRGFAWVVILTHISQRGESTGGKTFPCHWHFRHFQILRLDLERAVATLSQVVGRALSLKVSHELQRRDQVVLHLETRWQGKVHTIIVLPRAHHAVHGLCGTGGVRI